MATQILAPSRGLRIGSSYKIFLGGSIDMGSARDWQKEVKDGLDGYYVSLLNPRRTDWDSTWKQDINNPQFREQVTWEQWAMDNADFRIFCMTSDSKSPITLLELGEHITEPGAVCCEEGFYRAANVEITCGLKGMPYFTSLDKLLSHLRTILDYKGLRLPFHGEYNG